MRVVRTLAALAALAFAALPAHATTFPDGEFVTWGQVEWGDDPSPGNISFSLEENFASVFASSRGLLEVGIPGPTGFSIIFDGPDPIITYLPASGTPGPLTADLLNPVDTPTGALGGEVVTATLNVTFSDDDLLAHPAGVPFGNLVLQNLDSFAAETGLGPEIAELDGMSVRQVLAAANPLLDGGASPVTPQDMFVLLNAIDMSFHSGLDGGVASTFATENLAFPSSTTPTIPEPSTWAMVLLGFAGLGLAGWRRRALFRSPGLI